jgi:hypothetical protein
MKAATFVFLLAAYAAPSGDVTIEMSTGSPQYCLGPYLSFLFDGPKRDADDITLRLPLKLLYENHRSETIILPSWIHYVTRMSVAGQTGSTVLRSVGGGGMDAKAVMAMSRPDSRFFSIIAGGKYIWSTEPEGVFIPVVDRSSRLDLRGKTVQIWITRDYRSLTPTVVETLNEKWKDYGTVWAGVVESEKVTFRIPDEPLTRNCMPPLSSSPR